MIKLTKVGLKKVKKYARSVFGDHVVSYGGKTSRLHGWLLL